MNKKMIPLLLAVLIILACILGFGTKKQEIKNIITKNSTTSSVTVAWKTQPRLWHTMYEVYRCDDNDTKLYKSVDDNSVTIDNLKPGETVTVKIKPYHKLGGKKKYGYISEPFRISTNPKKVFLDSVSRNEEKTVMAIRWSSVDCTGYEVLVATDKKFKENVETYNVTKGDTTYMTVDTIPGKTYFTKVRAYILVDNNKYCGSWSRPFSDSCEYRYVSYTTTYYDSGKNRITNIEIATKKINGTVLMPGEEFDFDRIVGERTEENGFKLAPSFFGTDMSILTLGGGICQVSSTLFNALVYGNFDIVERHPHSQQVDYVPLGMDAAINWGTKNFRFKNNTDYPIKILITAKDYKLRCRIMTCTQIKPPNVELKVSRAGKKYTLRRYVDKNMNYTTDSYY
ncbi:MAG: VanW family protein [Eubacterium sp.]